MVSSETQDYSPVPVEATAVYGVATVFIIILLILFIYLNQKWCLVNFGGFAFLRRNDPCKSPKGRDPETSFSSPQGPVNQDLVSLAEKGKVGGGSCPSSSCSTTSGDDELLKEKALRHRDSRGSGGSYTRKFALQYSMDSMAEDIIPHIPVKDMREMMEMREWREMREIREMMEMRERRERRERREMMELREMREIRGKREMRELREIKEMQEVQEMQEMQEMQELQEKKEKKEVKEPQEIKEKKEIKELQQKKEPQEKKETQEKKEKKEPQEKKEKKEPLEKKEKKEPQEKKDKKETQDKKEKKEQQDKKEKKEQQDKKEKKEQQDKKEKKEQQDKKDKKDKREKKDKKEKKEAKSPDSDLNAIVPADDKKKNTKSSKGKHYDEPDFHTHYSDRVVSKFGSIEAAFAYDAPMRKMTIHILQARDIPCKERGGSTHTQVRLVMLPGKKQKHKSKIRSGDNPQFMESFLLHRVNPEDVNSMGVRLRLYGCERMRREKMIGETVVSFAALNLELETTVWLPLEPRANIPLNASATDLMSVARSDSTGSTHSMQHGGVPELLIGLAYNGTTGRLTVEVVKGSHFSLSNIYRNISSPKAPDTFIKLVLVSSTGHEIARCKSSVRKGQPNPLFKEMFMFQVALFQLQDVTLMVSVFMKRSMKRKDMIGWFTLGLNSSGEEEMAHWNDMRDAQGEQVCRWHILIDT